MPVLRLGAHNILQVDWIVDSQTNQRNLGKFLLYKDNFRVFANDRVARASAPARRAAAARGGLRSHESRRRWPRHRAAWTVPWSASALVAFSCRCSSRPD